MLRLYVVFGLVGVCTQNIILISSLLGSYFTIRFIEKYKLMPTLSLDPGRPFEFVSIELAPRECTPAPRVLFFPDSERPCKKYIDSFTSGLQLCDRHCNLFHYEDQEKSSLVYILERLRCAKKIDLCMFRFTLEDASDVLISLKRQGVAIRIIADKVVEELRNDRIPALKAAGIEVREMHYEPGINERERPLMHNKFVIIDRKSCLAGSFNWTWKGLLKNEEMVIEIHDRTAVEQIVERFEHMWARYSSKGEEALANV